MKNIIDIQNAQNLLEEIDDAFDDIPFGNSAFQCEMFVIAAQITPERAYRQIGMQLNQSLQAIVEHNMEYQKTNVDVAELKLKLKDESLSEKQFLAIQSEIFTKERHMIRSKKIVKDQIKEAEIYYKHFVKFPRYTRQDFENGEKLYYEQRLSRQILGCDGPKEAFINMTDDAKTIENFTNAYASLSHDQKTELLSELSKKSLAGYVQPPTWEEKND